MKPTLFLSALFIITGTAVQAQPRWFDAQALPLYGKGVDCTASRYERFPDSLRRVSREPLWDLSRNSAGMAIRFSTDSPVISARWTNTSAWGMNHMTDTGMRGLDLYILEPEGWQFAGTARPARDQKTSEATIIANMGPELREYMLYLPLYCGVESLEIGVDPAHKVSQPGFEAPRRTEPVVFYGTSILQGGCASRPGMAFTNIISRRLDREAINFGFSGNALLDYEVAYLMAGTDAGCYVLDFVPNASAQQILEKMEHFYRIIRDARPGTPMIFVEDPVFPHSRYDLRMAREIREKNEALHTVFDRLSGSGEKNIHLVPSEDMIGCDGEATVDGVHFTDLGMARYADLMTPVIERLMKKSSAEILK